MLEFVLAAPSIVSSSEPDALSNSLSQSLMTSVIGNTFKITKTNATHGTLIDDWGVVLKYASNVARNGRMEADIGFFSAEADAVAAAATAKALASAPADEGAIAAHAAAMAKAKGSAKGLSHGSMSAIHVEWRTVLGVAAPPPPETAIPAAVAAKRGIVEKMVFDAAWLPYVDAAGVTKLGLMRQGEVEAVKWGAVDDSSGNDAVRFTFVVGAEPGEQVASLTDLIAGISAGKKMVAKATAEAAAAAKAASEALGLGGEAMGSAGLAGGLLSPRVDVLKSAASSAGEFKVFLSDVMPWVVDSAKVSTVLKHESLALSEVEAWLTGFGSAASPEALASAVSKPASAEGLLMVCRKLEVASSAAKRAAEKPTNGSEKAYLQQPPDLTGTEAELRERTALRDDGERLSADEKARTRLAALANAAPGDVEALFQLAKEEPSEFLQRILFAGADVRKAVSSCVSPLIQTQIDSVRGALDRRCERAVLTSAEVEVASADTLRAIHFVRLGRIGRVRLLALAALSDSSSDEDPLGGFSARSDAEEKFRAGMSRLALAWQIAWPPHAGLVALFCDRLATFIIGKRAAGASWAQLSEYYRCLMLKVDAGAKSFALRESHSTFRTAPSIDWIEGRYEYVSVLKDATLRGYMQQVRQSLLDVVSSQSAIDSGVIAASGGLDAAQAAVKAAKAAKTKRKREAAKERKKLAKVAKSGDLPPLPNPDLLQLTDQSGKQQRAGQEKGGGTPISSKEKIEAEVASRVAAIGGRKPCAFFFGPAKHCRLPAETCANGHHGA